VQSGFTSGGCGKYKDWPPPQPPQPEPQAQAPSCAPSMPIARKRTWSATMGLVLEYSEEGKLVAERPSPPAPNLLKPAAPKH
jgi:hypothetical protein